MVRDEKAPSPKFWFYHEWIDEAGRFWAEPRNFQFVSDARREHAFASQFRWQTGKMFVASISCLYARDAIGVVILEPQQRPAGDSPRPPVPSGAGAGKVSSVDKAEAQRRDPGSIPGGSTQLPF